MDPNELEESESTCQVIVDETYCNWKSGKQPNREISGCLATWHVYEEHNKQWTEVFGDRPPVDPDPRDPLTREAMIAASKMSMLWQT